MDSFFVPRFGLMEVIVTHCSAKFHEDDPVQEISLLIYLHRIN